jgi:hypothetical protein
MWVRPRTPFQVTDRPLAHLSAFGKGGLGEATCTPVVAQDISKWRCGRHEANQGGPC